MEAMEYKIHGKKEIDALPGFLCSPLSQIMLQKKSETDIKKCLYRTKCQGIRAFFFKLHFVYLLAFTVIEYLKGSSAN